MNTAVVLRQTLAIIALAGIGLIPIGSLACAVACASQPDRPGTIAAHHCHDTPGARIASADHQAAHPDATPAPALLESLASGPGASAASPITPSIAVLPPLTSRLAAVMVSNPVSPPGPSILRI